MFQIKGKYAEQNVHIIAEDAADLPEALRMAVDYGMTEFYAINLNSSLKEIIRNPNAENGNICRVEPVC